MDRLTKNKPVLIILISALVVLLIFGLFFIFKADETPTVDDNATQTSDEPQNEVEELPETKLPPDEDENDEDDDSGVIYPQISSWLVEDNQVTVRGYIPEIVENGGTCTFTLFDENNEQIDSDATVGQADATTTTCPEVVLNIGSTVKFAQVQLEYVSTELDTVSPKVEIPL